MSKNFKSKEIYVLCSKFNKINLKPISEKKVVVVIPAKKKSRRLKNKNILPIKGKPMFLYLADEIKKSKKN